MVCREEESEERGGEDGEEHCWCIYVWMLKDRVICILLFEEDSSWEVRDSTLTKDHNGNNSYFLSLAREGKD